jgi:hypothetical protein
MIDLYGENAGWLGFSQFELNPYFILIFILFLDFVHKVIHRICEYY